MAGQKSNTIVLVSGGLDSAVCLAAICASDPEDCKIFPVFFYYGQRNAKECFYADAVVQHYRDLHRNVQELKYIHIRNLFRQLVVSSSITNPSLPLEKKKDVALPNTFVPGRNIIFLACMASYAEEVGADRICIGVNSVSTPGYPDCRAEFIFKMGLAITAGTSFPKKISTPVGHMSKAETIKLGLKLNAPLKFTWSCHDNGKLPCGKCDSCESRMEAFEELGLPDPAL